MLASSALAVVGAAVVYFLGDGPHGAPLAPRPSATAPTGFTARRVFAIPGFRASALGYFGHMWELYAFWSVLPWLCQPIAAELARRHGALSAPSVAFMSFAVIAIGSIGCVAGGQWSRRIGSARVAAPGARRVGRDVPALSADSGAGDRAAQRRALVLGPLRRRRLAAVLGSSRRASRRRSGSAARSCCRTASAF